MYQAPLDNRADIVTYVNALKERWWVVALVTVLFGLAGWFVAGTRTETFEASARVLVAPTPVGAPNPNVLNPVSLERESEVLRSLAIAERVSDDVGIEATQLLTDVSVRFIPASSVLRVTYSSEIPENAAEVVNGFAELYVDDRVTAARGFYDTVAAGQQLQLEATTADVTDLTSQLSDLDSEKARIIADVLLDPEVRSAEIQRIDTDRLSIATARNLAINQQRTLTNDVRDTEAELRILADPAEVLQLASVPDNPSSISRNVYIIGATLAGLLAGLTLALVAARFDSTARDKRDVERSLGASVLATIPSFGWQFRRAKAVPVMTMDGSKSRLIIRAREAFRRLRTALQFISSQRDIKSIVVTSSSPGEGKSQVAASLAISIARGGRRVALVSADMRRPTTESLFGMERGQQGLSTILAGEADNESLIEVGEPNFYLLPAGPAPENPGELLSGDRLSHLIEALEESVDFVIFDSPPILSTADALSIAPRVDGVLIVIDSTTTETEAVAEVRSQVEGVGGDVIGAVLNRDRQASRRFTLRPDPYAYETR